MYIRGSDVVVVACSCTEAHLLSSSLEFRQIQCLRLAVHGLAVAVSCGVEEIGDELTRHLGEFATDDWPVGFVPVKGSIRRFEEIDVLENVSERARAVRHPGPGGFEIYQEG